ncbi:hypothetical protein LZ24_02999 [Desulfobotulus alkaliphilus]|uniref:Uncharacterized protein n=1 Tax=Desulfobotulus alkaliphilus TaxID=622671 RepID=A0A562R9P7_9BACT|nr:hypothetical protein [Desulfobotulus alkaliphilus]TWI65767.1 hypothetical protein LZ24_02999 [Desulfobotulus alkaliphilus]
MGRSSGLYRGGRWIIQAAGVFLLCCIFLFSSSAWAGDEHWSMQFPKPAQVTQMSAGTGMADGVGSPSVRRLKWHDGKLWMAGVWQAGVDARDLGKRLPNQSWHLWTWSPESGYEVKAFFHSAQGGEGPDGVINDFVFLPDGRMVVAGEFTRLDNAGGNRYHRVNALAVYDPREPGPDRWRPLGRVQYNGTVSPGGSIQALAYDPKGDHLYIGGSFVGVPLTLPVRSNAFHRYSFKTGTYEILPSGPGGGTPRVRRIHVDTSTTPSTIYIAGSWHYVGGNGMNPENSLSTASYSTAFAAWQDGKGWIPYPKDFPRSGAHGKADGILQRAADYIAFDSVVIRDFLVDGKDIWICGSFAEGRDQKPLRGIARWDEKQNAWVDPTGRGGVGRDCFSVEKAGDGRIYFSGAFGGRRSVTEFYDGFKNGDSAHGVIAYDPQKDVWSSLGSGLSSRVMPEIRLVTEGHDVYIAGDFNHIGPENFGASAPAQTQSHYLARWNSAINFKDHPASVSSVNKPYGLRIASTGAPAGSEHWSRAFVAPQRGETRKITGMNDGTGVPDISGMAWIGDELYFGGSWEAERGTRWYVWRLHPERGYERVAWARGDGIQSPPEGIRAIQGRLYAYGAISSHSGIGVYDPAEGSWSQIRGTYRGQNVVGNTARGGTGVVNDIAFDERTGDLYIVGNWAPTLEMPGVAYPLDIAAALRIDAKGEYHIMGHDLKAEDPNKPVKGIYSIVLDTTKTPPGIFVAGTFNYYGPVPTSRARMAYNVARWDYGAGDWRPVGKGNHEHLSPLDKGHYPDGLPGLPAKTNEPGFENYAGFLQEGFPRILALALDKNGNLYAGGTLGIVSRNENVLARHSVETYGIARYDARSDTWGPANTTGGVSRDVRQMTWLDDNRLLLSGSFIYDEAWNPLHNVAVLDIRTGKLSPLGGGLLREGQAHVVGSQVVHAVRGSELWFAGLFDHAGVNANALHAAPVVSKYLAMYDPSRIQDPNYYLELSPVEPVKAPSGSGSASVNVELKAALRQGKGEIRWYERRSDGAYVSRGSGNTMRASLRLRSDSGDQFYYVSVMGEDGIEGGKLPVRIPVKQE